MGIGDEIMAAGRAEAHYEIWRTPVAIVDRKGRARMHPVWAGNRAIDPASPVRVVDGPHVRPYIRRWVGSRAEFDRSYRPRAGRLYDMDAARGFAAALDLPARFAAIEPIVRPPSSPNKDWGFARWAEVAAALDLPCVQLGPDDGRPTLPGARRIVTPDFRAAAAVIERARLVLTTEGGTHHLAAATARPAVVIFGAFTPPEMTGYAGHVNLAVETPEGYCGNYKPCAHCARAMASITPAAVVAAAHSLINATARGD